MAGFGARFLKGLVVGGVLGLAGLAGLSLALPRGGPAGRTEAPALRAPGPEGLVLPDPGAVQGARREGRAVVAAPTPEGAPTSGATIPPPPPGVVPAAPGIGPGLPPALRAGGADVPLTGTGASGSGGSSAPGDPVPDRARPAGPTMPEAVRHAPTLGAGTGDALPAGPPPAILSR